MGVLPLPLREGLGEGYVPHEPLPQPLPQGKGESTTPATFTTDIPARLDRLPWSRFHWLVIIALGIAWILDGLEVTIVGSLSGALSTVQFCICRRSRSEPPPAPTWSGSGRRVDLRLADRPAGRKKLFSITVLVYLIATIACGLSWNFASFALFRLITGAGIGGEYAAVTRPSRR